MSVVSLDTRAKVLPLEHFHPQEEKVQSPLLSFVKKVEEVALKGLAFLAACIDFPFRYIGSKTWSLPGLLFTVPYVLFKRALGIPSPYTIQEEIFGKGYHFDIEKRLTKEEAKEYLPYFLSTAFAYSSNPQWITPLGYNVISPKEMEITSQVLEARDACFFDPNSGLKIVLMEKENDVIISFGALKSDLSEVSNNPKESKRLYVLGNFNSCTNLLGTTPPIYHQANCFLDEILRHPRFQGKKITLTGQCYGGSLAQFLALKHELKAYCINSLPLGAGLQQEISDDTLMRADDFVEHISVEGDWLSDLRTAKYVDFLLSGVGIKTPGNFGRRFSIPSAYSSGKETHNYALGSLMSYLGLDKRVRVEDVPHMMEVLGAIPSALFGG
jgi:hypothetical protein